MQARKDLDQQLIRQGIDGRFMLLLHSQVYESVEGGMALLSLLCGREEGGLSE